MRKLVPQLLVSGIIVLAFLWVIQKLTFPWAASGIAVLLVGLLVWFIFSEVTEEEGRRGGKGTGHGS